MRKNTAPRDILARKFAMALAAAPVLLLPNAATAQDVDLGNLGDRGFRIVVIDAGDKSGISVSGAGDVNGDGLADLIVGAQLADPEGDTDAGESYVVFRASAPLPNTTYRARSRDGNPPPAAVGIAGDGSNDATPMRDSGSILPMVTSQLLRPRPRP